MGEPKFQYKNPLTLQLSSGLTASIDGNEFTNRQIQGAIDENVTLRIGQVVNTTSNTTFNAITSSVGVKLGDDSLFLGDGFISSSNSVVAHTGSIVVTENVAAPLMNLRNGKLIANSFEVSVTGSSILFDSGSSRFGDTLDDTHIISGSTSISGSFGLSQTTLNEISNDTALADSSANAYVTENAIFNYIDGTATTQANVPNRLAYLRKSFVHTGSFTTVATSSFTAVTASAPSGITATNEQDFMFFINGMLIENDALTIVQKTSTNLELRLNTTELGYEIASADEIIAFGKFNS